MLQKVVLEEDTQVLSYFEEEGANLILRTIHSRINPKIIIKMKRREMSRLLVILKITVSIVEEEKEEEVVGVEVYQGARGGYQNY